MIRLKRANVPAVVVAAAGRQARREEEEDRKVGVRMAVLEINNVRMISDRRIVYRAKQVNMH